MPTYLKLKVQAGARQDRLVVKSADAFVISVREPAEEGRANRAALALLAAHLGVPAQRLWIFKGAHQPAKIMELRDARRH